MKWEVPQDSIDQAAVSAPIAAAPEPTFWDHLQGAVARYGDLQSKLYSGPAVDVGRAAQKTVAAGIDEVTSPGFRDHAAANIKTSWDEAVTVNNTNASQNALVDAYDTVLAVVNKGRPVDQRLGNPARGYGGSEAQLTESGRAVQRWLGMPDPEADLWSAVAALKRDNPGLAANLPANHAELMAQMHAAQKAVSARAEAVQSQSGPVASTIGQILGGGAAGFADPVNVAAMGMGAPASSSLLRTFLTEGALNAGADAITLPDRIMRRQDIGLQAPGAGDIAAELAGDFLLGGSLPTGLKLAGRLLPAHAPAAELVKAFDERFPNPGEDARAARNLVADMARREADNPYAPTPQGLDEFRRNLLATTSAIDERQPVPEFRALDAGDKFHSAAVPESDMAAPVVPGEPPAVPPNAPNTAIAEPYKTPFAMSVAELEGALAEAKATDRQRLVMALGSEDAAKEFNRLDRARNATMDPARADAAAAEFDRKFGALTRRQELLIYGDANIPEYTPEDLRTVLDAKHAAAVLPDMPDGDLGRALSRAMLDITPDEMRAALAGEHIDARKQAKAFEAQSTMAEIVRRKGSLAAAEPLIADAMATRGYSAGDAAEVLASWQGKPKAPAPDIPADRALPAPPADLTAEARVALSKDFGDPVGGTAAFARQRAELAQQVAEYNRVKPGDALSDAQAGALNSAKPVTVAGGEYRFFRKDVKMSGEIKPGAPFSAKWNKNDHEFTVTGHDNEFVYGTPAKPQFGVAQSEIDALRSLPQDVSVTGMDHLGLIGPDSGPVTMKRVTLQIEREARAVEVLRSCLGGE